MKIGEQELAVEIVDESANGFSIEMDGGLGCEVGQVALLGNASGWSEVRVMNSRPQRSVEASELAEPISETRIRLGLVRLRDLESSEVEEDESATFSWGEVLRTICPIAPLGWILGVAACLVCGGSLIFGLVWTLDHTEASDHILHVEAPPMRAAAEDSRAPFAGAARETKPRAPESSRPREHAPPPKVVAQKSNPASPVASLLPPGDRESLALSQEQFQQLRQTLDEYRTTEGEVAGAKAGIRGSSGADNAEIELGRRCLEIFTEKQRGSLMRLLARSGTLFKQDVTDRLALTPDQLNQLHEDFSTFETAVKDQATATPDSTSVAQADAAEIQFGRRSLEVLTEKQRGTLMRLAVADLGCANRTCQIIVI